jgi:hypothetical protein
MGIEKLHISFEYDVSAERIEALGLRRDIDPEWLEDGGDVILLDGKPAGWIRADGMGVIEALEIVPRIRGRGLTMDILHQYCGGSRFVARMPHAALRALARTHLVRNEGDGTYRVVPRCTARARFARHADYSL